MKPTLWRVAAYSPPGIAEPDDQPRPRRPVTSLGSRRLGADDFAVRPALAGGRRFFEFARRARRFDRDDHGFRRRDQLEPGGQRNVAGGDVVVHAERRYVDFDDAREFCSAGPSTSISWTMTSITAPMLRTPSATPAVTTGKRRDDRFVGRDALQIGVEDAPRDRIGLHVAHERRLLLCAPPVSVMIALRPRAMEQLFERVRVDGDVIGSGTVSVDDRGNLPGTRATRWNRSCQSSRDARLRA